MTVLPTSHDSPSSPPERVTGDSLSLSEVAEAKTSISARDRDGFWAVFFSTFGTIFLAELGDKTQLATLMMSAQSGHPWIVFLGAGTALILTSLLGVAVGQWIAQKVSPHTLDTAAGVVLLAITLGLLWDVTQG